MYKQLHTILHEKYSALLVNHETGISLDKFGTSCEVYKVRLYYLFRYQSAKVLIYWLEHLLKTLPIDPYRVSSFERNIGIVYKSTCYYGFIHGNPHLASVLDADLYFRQVHDWPVDELTELIKHYNQTRFFSSTMSEVASECHRSLS